MKKNNRIMSLDINDQISATMTEIKSHTVSYYKSSIKESVNKYANIEPGLLKPEEQMLEEERVKLEKLFSEDEIKAVVFAYEPNRYQVHMVLLLNFINFLGLNLSMILLSNVLNFMLIDFV